uniref:Reverse transcriptase Ty1/copia-type domain-containing protein n=1 Tax=Fagus sylvatica TaxID=28930 RepID=A0A2N9EVC6_FAGSY
MNETNLNLGLDCVVFSAMVSLKRVFVAMISISRHLRISRHVEFWEHQTFSSCQHFPFIFSSMTPIFTDPSIDLYPDLVRDSAPPLSSSDVLSLALSPAAGSPASDLAPSAPSESPTDLRRSTRSIRSRPELMDLLNVTRLVWLPGDSLKNMALIIRRLLLLLPVLPLFDPYLLLLQFRHWPLFQMDVKNAFINGDLLEEVYMQPPPGYPNSQNQGFTPSSYDSALFIRHTSTGITLILLYVDDMIITGDDTAGICDLQKFLSQHFEMKDLGTLNYFLGLKVTSSSDGYYLSSRPSMFLIFSLRLISLIARLFPLP